MTSRAASSARRQPGKASRGTPGPDVGHAGLVVAVHGRHCLVEAEDGSRLICHPRGKKSEVVVGDRVRWQPTPGCGDEGVIQAVEPRRNLLWRQDEWRSKSFAANLDQLLMWVAVEPVFSEAQLTRALIAADAAGIQACIVLNKIDLPGAEAARARLAPYRDMGYDLLECSLKHEREPSLARLGQRLRGRATLVLGPSGAGKSTLVNAFVPHAQAEVGAISQALNSGRHTTTVTRWYALPNEGGAAPPVGGAGAVFSGALIDSPGFQEFGLHHIAADRLASHMPDLAVHLGGCRFHNCTHRQEPGCAVVAAVARGAISPQRLRLYQSLYDELSQTRW